ncbi:MAG: transposase, partial [Sphingomonadaceae bacterium]
DFQRAWDNWEPEITSYFDHRITNAYTESLNNLIRITNRIGRGYSFEALRAKILLSESARKTRPPKFQRIAHAEQALPVPSMFPRHLGVSLSTLAQDFCAEGEEVETTVNYG